MKQSAVRPIVQGSSRDRGTRESMAGSWVGHARGWSANGKRHRPQGRLRGLADMFSSTHRPNPGGSSHSCITCTGTGPNFQARYSSPVTLHPVSNPWQKSTHCSIIYQSICCSISVTSLLLIQGPGVGKRVQCASVWNVLAGVGSARIARRNPARSDIERRC